MPDDRITFREEELYSVKAFAAKLGITRQCLVNWTNVGRHGVKLPRIRRGGCWRYSESDYVRWEMAVDQAKARDSAPDKRQRKRRDKAAFEILAREGMLPKRKQAKPGSFAGKGVAAGPQSGEPCVPGSLSSR